jgi:hypothetical protein
MMMGIKMEEMMNELVATYFINGKEYDVLGCYDQATPNNEFDFYDVYELPYQFENEIYSTCINEGDPFYEMPSRQDVKNLIIAKSEKLRE